MFGGDLTDQAGAGTVAEMVAKTIYPSNLPLLAIGLMAWIESRAIGPTLFFEGSEVPGKQSADASISGDNIVAVLAILEGDSIVISEAARDFNLSAQSAKKIVLCVYFLENTESNMSRAV